MATTLIGTLRPRAKGVHVQDNAYNIMDVVTSADGIRAYMAVQNVPAGTALTDAAYWCIYTDMSTVKTSMEDAAARADASAASANEAINNLTGLTNEYALRVRGEIGESTGNPLTIEPDEGSLIRPVTVFVPKQAGEGTPSPDNVRPISGYDALELNISNGEQERKYSANIGQTVYGGRMDWNTGMLTVDYAYVEFDGSEDWVDGGGYFRAGLTAVAASEGVNCVCSHYPYEYAYAGNGVFAYNNIFNIGAGASAAYGSLENWKNTLAAWKASGTPMQVAFKLAEPFTIQFTPHQMLALKGTNTLYGDGDINVKWVKPLETSIAERLEPLIERIEALEG